MRTLLDKALDLAFGAADMTREKAQELVDELVKRGEAAREESSTMVDDLVRRGQRQREELQTLVRREVSDTLSKMNLVTKDDAARLERRIQEMETLVEDLRAGAAAEPVAAPPPEATAASSVGE